MTEAPRPRRRRSLSATTAKVAALAGAATIAVSGGLYLQMAAGRDPVLGPKQQAVADARALARPTVKRRVVKRTVIVRKVEDPAPAEAPAQSAAPASSPPVASAPAPAPAPAPTPAPVVTRTS
jgi:hypothetical protein